MFQDSSVPAGGLTRLWPNRLCNWIPGAHSMPPLPQHPGIYLVLFLPCHECITISLLWLPHISWRRAWEQPLARTGALWVLATAGHPPQEELLYPSAPSPLAGGPTTFQLPEAQFLAFVYGAGGATTSLAPPLHSEAKVAPSTGHCAFGALASGSVGRSEREWSMPVVC